ncbi:MAG: ribulose-phosphate 3-epimerase [Bacteroidales bacterium]|nr:ribulose-phosphate 3-epimerase [Bacteroidales bacterium]MCM1147952.1 ribulose-phosphate 3-epimerase [Bacteroidales bacterium]MCM1206876.1 ribulose-phosphate 3-epimerase [Bacillota bacterium]MCM1509509.1 ribulose-phosphate 3-epimerase [Clostridium sp.]
MAIVSPSLLAADFLHLENGIEMINQSEADWLHLDIMDGMFVPNISFGFSVLDAISKVLKKPMDVHYMTMRPEDYVERTASLGAMSMNFHIEACGDRTADVIRRIHDAGMKAAITISPDTPVNAVRPHINNVEMVLVMSVYPGFGGQKFIEATIERVQALKLMIAECGSKALIEVDGGVDSVTAPRLVKAGCDALVSGSYIFKAKNPIETIASLKRLTL